uniref:DUF5745 domain-containing protein n=1 Tax=Octopus bimaculoides TaxID=37653 RepID=A0A0L8H3G0_OCTBM
MSSQAIIDKGLVSSTNKLLQHLHVYQEVKCVADITAETFVIIFEGLYGENLPELHGKPLTKEDNIHNCQVVIDALATKVLNTSLSHITGESIVNGNRMAINNLLEIFTDLFEFLTEKIEAVEDVVDDGLEDFIQDKVFLEDWIHQKHIENYKEKLSSPGATSGCSRFAWQDSTTVAEKEDDLKTLEPDILNRTMTLRSYHVPDVTEPAPSVPYQTPEILQPTYPPKQVQRSSKIQNKVKEDFVPLFKPPEYITKVDSSCQTIPFYDEPLKDKNYQEDLNGPSKIIGSDTKTSSFPTNIRRNSDSSTQTEKSIYSESNDILEQYRPGRSTDQLLDMIESALKQLEIESQPTCYNKIHQKQVHFEDVYKPKEKSFHQNPIVCHDWKKNKQLQFLKKNYSEDLAQFSEDVKVTLKNEKTAANMKEYRNPSSTSVKHQRPLMRRSGKTLSVTSHQRDRRKPVTSTSRKTEISGEALLPTLLDDLPLLHLSTDTWHELWRKNIVQLEHLTKSYYEKHRKRDNTRQQIKDAEKRREILHDIMKKELSHMHRLKEIKESKKRRIEVRNRLHEKRIVSAKARRYYDDFSVRMRSRMMNRKTKEELSFLEEFACAPGLALVRVTHEVFFERDEHGRYQYRLTGLRAGDT